MKKIYSIVLSALLALVIFQCANKPTDVASGGSDHGNALVSGYLYNFANGSPAAGAKVRFVRAGYDPYHNTLSKAFVVTDSTITDSNGAYMTNNLDSGTYNVFGVGADGNLSLVDSFQVTGDTQVVNTDTLKGPSNLTGHIKLQPGDEPDKIIAIAMGSNTFSLISTDAQFSFANLAEGHYAVKFFSTLDNYSNYDTTFTIVAGTNVSLPDSIVMPLKIPIPTGFTLKYDTLKQIVTLSWNRMNPAKVKGYNVYRQHVDSAGVKLNAQPLLDTFYVDSTGVQDQTYIYSVASVDLGNKEGYQTPGDSVKVVSAFAFERVFVPGGFNAGEVSGPVGLFSDTNGNIYVADAANYRVQKFDSSGGMILKLGGRGTADGLFVTPQDIAVDSKGNIYVTDYNLDRVQKFSGTGSFIAKWPTKGHVCGIAIDKNDRVVVATEQDLSFIQIFDATGALLSEWRTLTGNLDLAIGEGDTLYASSRDNRMTAYLSNGTTLTSWVVSGLAADQGFRFARDINGYFYIPFGYGNNFVRAYTAQGTLVAQFGASGTTPGKFDTPVAACLSIGRVYICDNNRIQIFSRP